MKNTLKILGIIALAALIGFTIIGCKKDTSGASTGNSAATTGKSGATNFLADYETFVNEYVDVMKKIDAGDLSVLSKVEELVTKAEEMEKRFQNISESDFTKAQLQKYSELTQLITD